MTRPWLALWRALLNVNFGLSAMRAQIRRRERLWEPLLIAAAVLVGVGSITFILVQVIGSMLQVGLQVGQPEIILTLAHFAAAIVVLLFGLAYVMGTFYFANDTSFLMAWPLRPRHILSAKFATILVNEYLTTLIVLVPVYVMYALHVPVGPLYIPSAILVFLLTPVIPLAVAALLVVLLMRVVSVSRRRDFFTMVGGLLLVVGVLVLQYFIQAQAPDLAGESDIAELIFGQAHGLSKLAASGYPPSYWSMLALAEAGSAGGLAALGGLIVGGLVVVFALLFAGERLFLSAAQSAGASRAQRSRAATLSGGASPVRSVAKVERKLFMRTPMYVLNGFAGFLIFPVIVLLPEFTDAEEVTALLRAGLANPHVGLIAVWGWFAAATGLSIIPATAFSREGQRLWVIKSLPISGREYFLGKLLGAESMILVGALPGAAVLVYVLGLGFIPTLAGAVLGVCTSVLVAVICLAIDMMRPWLTWTDPTRAIKSNINGLLGMVVTLALIAVPVWGGLILAYRGIPETTLIASVAALYAALLLGLWLWIAPRLDPLLQRMGD